MEPAKKKKGRPPADKPAEKQAPSLKLTAAADNLLTAQTKKLKLSKREYASAAVTHFAERGLNPMSVQPQSLADIAKGVSQEGRSIRVQNVDIGNRLISILKTWEKGLYGFLQQQQSGTVNYLEQIENNILRHQVAIETNLLSPMVEMLVRNNIESYLGRVLGERTNLHVTGKNPAEWTEANKALTTNREQKVVVQMREFIKTNSVPVPNLAPKPQVPTKAPAAPAAAPGTAPK